MKVKRFLSILLVFTMLFCLASCAKEDSDKDEDVVDYVPGMDKDFTGENDKDKTGDKGDTDVGSVPFISERDLNYDVYEPTPVKTASTDGADLLYPIYFNYYENGAGFDFAYVGAFKIEKTVVDNEYYTIKIKSLDRDFNSITGDYYDSQHFTVEITNKTDEEIIVPEDVSCAVDGRAAFSVFRYEYDFEKEDTVMFTQRIEPNSTETRWLYVYSSDWIVEDYGDITGVFTVRANNETVYVPFSVDIKSGVYAEYPYEDMGYEIYNNSGITLRVLGYDIDKNISYGDRLDVYIYMKNKSDTVVSTDIKTDKILVNGKEVKYEYNAHPLSPNSTGVYHIQINIDDITPNIEGFIDDIVFQIEMERPEIRVGDIFPNLETDVYTFRFSKELA